MRLALRLVWMLAVGLTLISIFFTWQQIRRDRRNMQQEVERRAGALTENLADSLEPAMAEKSKTTQVQRVLKRFGKGRNSIGVVVYDNDGKVIAQTPELHGRFAAGPPPVLLRAMTADSNEGEFVRSDGASLHLYGVPLHEDKSIVGGLILVQETGNIDIRIGRLWREAALRMLLQVLFITGITVLIVRRSVLHPLARTMQWIKAVRAGRASAMTAKPDDGIFSPFTEEVTTLAQGFSDARASAALEARLRDMSDSIWTAERLSVHVKAKLNGSRIVVVANREPYMHRFRGRAIETIVPASGLVTALEPILNACDGTWVAHGSGDADREMVDNKHRIRVPPKEPHYTLRRVWLSKQEEEGYYYGFSNEGLWPLCHIAHTRPIFRASDWEQYEAVNRKFAEVVLDEIDGLSEPTVLVQDYHFALLPRLIKEKRPDARIAIFWHIPWPNPEAFGICPWQGELLDGLLGADLIGFHVQTHCHNFLETVDRALECRIDWPSNTVTRNYHKTDVRPFPISVDFNSEAPDLTEKVQSYHVSQAQLLREMGMTALYLGVGVDRVDYTKGIPERFAGIERFLEKYPGYIGKFTFLQIGAPSRTHIKRYHDLMTEVEAEAERINWKFKAGNWKPIIFLNRHHDHNEIERIYKLADFCLVTSLHDGMNLVAKEFLASRADEEGMLILSRFAGAANELRDAIIVNPYASDEIAEAIRLAIEMSPDERRRRMRWMRQLVKEQNIYRWAGSLISELSKVQLGTAGMPVAAVKKQLKASGASIA
jgi:trehalose-6-phosphate synthase